jgi:hypothetical protein
MPLVAIVIGVAGCGGRQPVPRPPVAPFLSPSVEAVLLAHEITPQESLRVRLLGTVGPRGYRLHEVAVIRLDREVYLVPTVARSDSLPGVAPTVLLDHTVTLPLQSGRWLVHVLTVAEDRIESVVVRSRIRRLPPVTRIEVADPYAQSATTVHLHVRGECRDGYVDVIEIRRIEAGTPGPWRLAEVLRRDGAALVCSASLPRNGQELSLEARAVDGQGTVDPSPASFTVR